MREKIRRKAEDPRIRHSHESPGKIRRHTGAELTDNRPAAIAQCKLTDAMLKNSRVPGHTILTNHSSPGTFRHALPVVQRKIGLEQEKKILDSQNRTSLHVKPDKALAPMLVDDIKRMFTNAAELNMFLDKKTDYIGDVKGKWVRFDPNKFYVLGEIHENKKGTVPDVIKGVNTRRFMYEAFHYLPVPRKKKTWRFPGVRKILKNYKSQEPALAKQGGANALNPAMENLVVKIYPALWFTKAFVRDVREETDKKLLEVKWKFRKNKIYVLTAERGAHYLRYAILMARDMTAWKVEKGSPADKLVKHYLAHKTLFDTMASKRDDNRNVWMYDMFPNRDNATLSAAETFAELGTAWLIDYTARYAKGIKDKQMQFLVKVLPKYRSHNPLKQGHPIDMIRERIMIRRLRRGKGKYLIAGMGDRHRQSLQSEHSDLADEWHFVIDYMKDSNNKSAQDYDAL